MHAEGERFDPVILHQVRPPLLNPEKLCGNNLQYISSHGKIKRPDVIDQGTLQVVAFFAPMVELVDTLVLGTSAKAWGFESL